MLSRACTLLQKLFKMCASCCARAHAQGHHLLFDLRYGLMGKSLAGEHRVDREFPTKGDTYSPPPSNYFTACKNFTWRPVTRLNKTTAICTLKSNQQVGGEDMLYRLLEAVTLQSGIVFLNDLMIPFTEHIRRNDLLSLSSACRSISQSTS